MSSDIPNKVCMRPDATGNYVQSDYCHQLEESLATARHSFKNFHRALCERFNYCHDEKDWERDQISLIEHIASLPTAAAVDEAKPSAWMWESNSGEVRFEEFSPQYPQKPVDHATPLYTRAQRAPVEQESVGWAVEENGFLYMNEVRTDLEDAKRNLRENYPEGELVPIYRNSAPHVPVAQATAYNKGLKRAAQIIEANGCVYCSVEIRKEIK